MAGAARVITLDIGTYTVKMGEFQLGGNGQLQLNRFGTKELGLDPNKEEARFPAVTSTLTELMGQLGIKSQPTIMSISGQSVFLRFVKLPPVDAVAVEQMISFEAQQNVPFPINEVVWDYQLLPGRVAGETEAIIVAMKADMLETEYRAAETAGLRTKHIDVSPLALYNAYRYNYPTLEDCTLLLDMGARTTNLIFIEGGHLYTRSVPIAGNLLSQNICNDLQEPFVAAETLKKGKGFVSLGGAYADPEDRDAARISKLIRTTMTRLHNEINRSINFYRTQQGGSAPKRVLLSGGSSQLPYLDVFIAEKLNLDVQYFNPLQNVTVAPTVDKAYLEENACYAGEIVGLALRESGECPVEVGLVPPELEAKQAQARERPYYFLALAAWLVFFVLLSLYNWQQTQIAEGMTAKIEAKNSELKSFKAKTEELTKEADATLVEYGAVKKLVRQREDWAELLEAINLAIPPGVWITSLDPQYRGLALDTLLQIEPEPDPNQQRGRNQRRRAPAAKTEPQLAPEITELHIKGLYHSHKDTMAHNGTIITEFEKNLVALPWFSEVANVATEATQRDNLASAYSMIIKLEKPLDIKP